MWNVLVNSMRRTLPPFCWMMVFGYVGYLLKILLKIVEFSIIFKMICVVVIVETVLKWWLERLSWEIVMKFLLNEVFEWWFYEIVMKVLLNKVLERLSWEIVLKWWLDDVFEWWFYEIVMKWCWKCRGVCRVMWW